MKTTNRMMGLYTRLQAVGITPKYAREFAFPAGWNDKEAENPAVYSQAIGLLARNFNLDLRSLQDETKPVIWKDCGPTRFLKHKNVTEDDVTLARCIAARAAQVASYVMTGNVPTLPTTAKDIRAEILKTDGCVSFRALVSFCWNIGIPVLHVSQFPLKAKKPTGMAAMFDGRAVIVLCRRHKYSAWMLFWIAHELGHIIQKHLDRSGLFVDAQIEYDSLDEHELEANAFALELLTGKPDMLYAPYTLNPQMLAENARRLGKRDQVDPGIIALNYAWNKGRFDLGNAALNLLEQNDDPVEIIRAEMKARLCWSEMSRDNREFLRRITETD